jgi:membrane protein YdbS with pleckstrin-like domain
LVVSHGLRVRGWKLETPDEVMPKSGMVVLEKMIAPASRSRAGAGESYV